MSLRRILTGTAAIAALSLLGTGVAFATGDPTPPPPAGCSAPTDGTTTGSPGVNSGNLIQVPVGNCADGPLVYAPMSVNVCGNTINFGGQLNPAFGNTCTNQNGSSPE